MDHEASPSDWRIPEIKHLDLDIASVWRHFQSADSGLLHFLITLDRLDTWAVDFNEMASEKSLEIQAYLVELGQLVRSSASVLHTVPQELAHLLAHLTSSRCLYLIRYVSQQNPSFLGKLEELMLESVGSDHSDLTTLNRRFFAFEKAKVLSEIFSASRLMRIASIMQRYRSQDE
jgi:hypothetical protein